MILNEKKNIKVLIVDDAVLITKRISEMILEVECVAEIFVADSFLSANDVIHIQIPDIILLDIHLPDRSGMDLLEVVKEKFPAIIVVMVTNKVSQYYKDLCIEKGATYFIDKSKEFESIPSILKNFCTL